MVWSPLHLVEDLASSVAVFEPDGTVVYVNAAMEKMLGRARAELVGVRVWEKFPESVGNPVYQAFQRVAATGQGEGLDYYEEGTGRWYRNDLHGLDGFVHIVACDITEKKLAERRQAIVAQAAEAFAAPHSMLELASLVERTFESAFEGTSQLWSTGTDGQVTRATTGGSFGPGDLALVSEAMSARHALTDQEAGLVVAPIRDGSSSIGCVTLRLNDAARPPDLALLEDLAQRASVALVRIRWQEERAKSLRRAAILVAASRAFSAARLNTQEVLEILVQSAMGELGECVVASILSDDGQTFAPAVVRHEDPERERELRQLMTRAAFAGSMSEQVIESGRPIRKVQLEPESLKEHLNSEHATVARRLHPRSMILVPIFVAGKPLGTLWASRHVSTVPHDDDDERLLEDLTSRASLAIENARVIAAERSARERAQRVADLTRRVQNLAGSLAHRLPAVDVAQQVLRESSDALSGLSAAIWLVASGGEHLDMLASVGYQEPERYRRLSLDDSRPIGRAVRSAQPCFIRNADDYRRDFPASVARLGAQTLPSDFSTACLPLQIEGRVIGGIAFAFSDAREFVEDERTFFQLLTDQCAQALDRALLSEQERAARESLANSNRTLSAIVAASPAAILLLDLDGTVRLWNAAAERIFGWPTQDVLDRPLPPIDAGDRADLFNNLTAIRAGKRIDGMELRRVTREGSTIDVALWAAPLERPDGSVQCLAIVVDITDRKRAEEEARAADRRKDEFLALLGHELRNPLAPIVTALELIKVRGAARDSREVLVIERQTRHLIHLVDDLLDISRITRGKVRLQLVHLDIADVVTRAVEMASPLFEQQRHQLDLHVQRGAFFVSGDELRLVQVVQNLLVNAAKYTRAGGRIHLRVVQVDTRVCIEVEDNGIGIPATLLPEIFEPFVQGERTLERAGGGLGIGLALVRSLVGLHGGTVSAASGGAGQGSRFVIDLPLHAASADAVAAPPPKQSPKQTSGRRVLLVDDNQDAAEVMAEFLRMSGFDVVVAHDGPGALSLVTSFAPDVAVLDIGLPVMDGYELAGRLREALRVCPRLVALTGYGQDHDRARSREAGFAIHLVKPVELPALLAAIGE